jgi:hypothetical protein
MYLSLRLSQLATMGISQAHIPGYDVIIVQLQRLCIFSSRLSNQVGWWRSQPRAASRRGGCVTVVALREARLIIAGRKSNIVLPLSHRDRNRVQDASVVI